MFHRVLAITLVLVVAAPAAASGWASACFVPQGCCCEGDEPAADAPAGATVQATCCCEIRPYQGHVSPTAESVRHLDRVSAPPALAAATDADFPPAHAASGSPARRGPPRTASVPLYVLVHSFLI